MFKPYTIEHYKVFQFLKEQFELESCVVSPLSRCTLMLEDRTGERIAFAWENQQVMEIPIPEPASPEEIQTFMEWFHSQQPQPQLRTRNALAPHLSLRNFITRQRAAFSGMENGFPWR